jgi:hypothetical protein
LDARFPLLFLRRTLVKPTTEFNGVRSSWLMVARNWLLARLAASAARFAVSRSMVFCRSSSVCCRTSDSSWRAEAIARETVSRTKSPPAAKITETSDARAWWRPRTTRSSAAP